MRSDAVVAETPRPSRRGFPVPGLAAGLPAPQPAGVVMSNETDGVDGRGEVSWISLRMPQVCMTGLESIIPARALPMSEDGPRRHG